MVYTAISTALMVHSIVKSVSVAGLRSLLTRVLSAIRSPRAALKGLSAGLRAFGADASAAFGRFLRRPGAVLRTKLRRFFWPRAQWPSIRAARARSLLGRWRPFGQNPFYNWEHIVPQMLGERFPALRPFINSFMNTFLRLPMEFNSALGARLVPKLIFYHGAFEALKMSWRLGKWVGTAAVQSEARP
jgi:hypothetical protein